MDAKELRVGNWVIDGDGDENQVEEICPYSCGKNDFRWDWLKSVEPIPLTEEWLVRFGFKDNNYTFDLMANRKKLSFGWYARVVSSGVRRGFSMGKYKHIKHVHQLQNLYFALTGKELESTQTQKI
jgi:hypothetical protein